MYVHCVCSVVLVRDMCLLYFTLLLISEALHTILLGPCMYLLRTLMECLCSAQKEEIEALIASFNFSGFDDKLSYNMCHHYHSFVGRDFKVLAQMVLLVLGWYDNQ